MAVQDALRGFADRRERGGGLSPPTERSSTPPEDRGERLATFPRGDVDQLRVSIDELSGHRFVTARIWERDSAGSAWWPSKRGITIRAHELVDFAAAIATAVERLGVAKGGE